MYKQLLIAAGALALAATSRSAAEARSPQAGDPAPAASAQDPFRWSGRIAAGKAIEVKGVQGTIRAVPASGNEVEVVATRRGARSATETVRLEVVTHEGGVTICAVYPRQRGPSRRGREDGPGRSAEHNRCEAGEWRDLNVNGNDVRVDFTVRVPAGVNLLARNVSGDVEAEGLRSNVDARSVSGDVRFSTTGYGEASTVSGGITASMGSANWRGDLDFRTVSGDITVEIPARTSTEVRLETMSGDVDADFALETERRTMRTRARGTLGQGGRELYLTTLSGDVRLRRAR